MRFVLPQGVRRRGTALARVGAVLAAALALLAGPAAAAPATAADATTGSISGTVTVPAGFDPRQVDVWVTSPGHGFLWPTSGVGADGTWTATALPPDTYTVSFNPRPTSGLLPAATPVSVTLAAGQAVTGVDATLLAAGRMSGHLTAPAGTDLSGLSVTVQGVGGNLFSSGGSVAADGTWSVGSLQPGSYVVRAGRGIGQVDVAPSFIGGPTLAQATVFTVASGQVISGLELALVRGGHVSGRVTDSTGAPVANAEVDAFADGWDPGDLAGTLTDADGRYTLTALPTLGIRVLVQANGDPTLVAQYWPGVTDGASAGTVSVTAAADTTGVDVVLPRAGTVTGTLTADPGFDFYSVSASTPLGHEVASTWGALGTPYVLGGLPSGSYVISARVWSSNGGGQTVGRFYPGTDRQTQATRVGVTAGASTGGIDIDLRGATLGGAELPTFTATPATTSPVVGKPLQLAVAVAGAKGAGHGVVSVWSGESLLADAELVNGAATLTVTPGAVGAASYEVTYGGDGSYSGQATSVAVTVVAAPPTPPKPCPPKPCPSHGPCVPHPCPPAPHQPCPPHGHVPPHGPKPPHVPTPPAPHHGGPTPPPCPGHHPGNSAVPTPY